jgi:deoxycytidine triphosphate deaminase
MQIEVVCICYGWRGWLTLEISNNSLDEVVINAGEPIAQIVFEMLDFPTEQPYAGKYQNQERGPQSARRDRATLDELRPLRPDDDGAPR